MTVKVSICNLDHHRKIVVTQCGQSEGRPTGTRTPVLVDPLSVIELYVHGGQTLEVHEAQP